MRAGAQSFEGKRKFEGHIGKFINLGVDRRHLLHNMEPKERVICATAILALLMS